MGDDTLGLIAFIPALGLTVTLGLGRDTLATGTGELVGATFVGGTLRPGYASIRVTAFGHLGDCPIGAVWFGSATTKRDIVGVAESILRIDDAIVIGVGAVPFAGTLGLYVDAGTAGLA